MPTMAKLPMLTCPAQPTKHRQRHADDGIHEHQYEQELIAGPGESTAASETPTRRPATHRQPPRGPHATARPTQRPRHPQPPELWHRRSRNGEHPPDDPVPVTGSRRRSPRTPLVRPYPHSLSPRRQPGTPSPRATPPPTATGIDTNAPTRPRPSSTSTGRVRRLRVEASVVGPFNTADSAESPRRDPTRSGSPGGRRHRTARARRGCPPRPGSVLPIDVNSKRTVNSANRTGTRISVNTDMPVSTTPPISRV